MNADSSSSSRTFLQRYRYALICVILAVITFVTFIPSLGNGFVNRDDPPYVVDNLAIRGPGGGHLAKIFSSVYVGQYVPVTMLTYMAEYRLWGLDPRGYHATSLLLHIVNVLLVFVLFSALSKSCFVGAITALLFGLHPFRVEAVAWIAERKEVLSALFCLLSLLCYYVYRKKGRRKYYFLSLLALLISLMSKQMAVSQPFVLVLIDYLTGRKIDKKSLLEKAPFFALSAVFAATAILTVREAIRIYPGYSFFHRLIMPAYSIVFYLVKTIVPVNLCASYYLPETPERSMTIMMVFSAAAVAGSAAAVYYSRRYTKTAVFGALFFLVTLLPVLQIVNSGGMVIVADRYTYMPMLGMNFIVAVATAWLVRKKFQGHSFAKVAVCGCAAAWVAVLCILAWQRCGVWNNSVTLWTDIIKKVPPEAQAYCGRGTAYLDRGEYRTAIVDFNRAVEVKPDYAGAYFGRGYIYCAYLGQVDSGIADLRRAVGLSPNYPDAWNALGIAEGMKGAYGRAIGDFNRAIDLKADFVGAYVNRGIALMQGAGDATGATADFARALSLDPSFAKAYLMRGVARGMQGLFDGAIADFTMAIRMNPRDTADAMRFRASARAKKAGVGRQGGSGWNGK